MIGELLRLRGSGFGLTNSIHFLEDFHRCLATDTCDRKCEAGSLYLDVHPDGALCVCKEKPPAASVLDDHFLEFYRSAEFRELAAEVAAFCTGCFFGEYREPWYVVRNLGTFREWVVGWARSCQRGMRMNTAITRDRPSADRGALEREILEVGPWSSQHQ